MWRCFVRDQARVPSVAGAVAPFFVTGTVFFSEVPITYVMPRHGGTGDAARLSPHAADASAQPLVAVEIRLRTHPSSLV